MSGHGVEGSPFEDLRAVLRAPVDRETVLPAESDLCGQVVSGQVVAGAVEPDEVTLVEGLFIRVQSVAGEVYGAGPESLL